MTAYAATQVAKSQTLVAATVDSVQLCQFGNQIRIINSSATATDRIFATVGSKLQPPADPTSAGDDCYAVLPGPLGITIPWPVTAGGGVTNPAMVKLISATTPTYTVQLSGDR